jgi:hypothetical protein
MTYMLREDADNEDAEHHKEISSGVPFLKVMMYHHTACGLAGRGTCSKGDDRNILSDE